MTSEENVLPVPGTKGALFTSGETAQPLRGVRRVPTPAALPERRFAALPELSVEVHAVNPAAPLPEDPARRQKGVPGSL